VTGSGPAFLWIPVFFYMAFLFALSSIRYPPEPPGAFAFVSDKTVHVLLYAGLSALVVRALAGGWRRTVKGTAASLAVAISVLYGATDEIHQHFVPPREMDGIDLAADAAGATLAASALYLASRIRERRGESGNWVI
jgi:VanZ family protein